MRMKWIAVLIAVLALGAIAAGCGGDDSTSSSSTTEATSSDTSTTEDSTSSAHDLGGHELFDARRRL